MNEQVTNEAPDLPELSDDAIERLERGVFDDIARGRANGRRRQRTRRRWTLGSLGAVAAVAALAIVVPMAGQLTAGGDAAVSDAAPEQSGGDDSMGADTSSESVGDSATMSAEGDAGGAAEDAAAADRMVVRTGSVGLTVDDVVGASDELTDLVSEYDGYVDDMGTSGGGADGATTGWVGLRIPADDLDALRADLADIGEVTRVEISESDVTSQAIDMQARVDSLTASVDRLQELMEKAGSVKDLLAAESALSERQAELESIQRELDYLEDQVSMSTLHVELTRKGEPTKADPAGFGDGFLSGWSGLVAFVNGLVIAIGFALPWIAAIAVAGLLVWLIIRIARRRRA